MGNVKPELRVLIKDLQEGEFVSQYADIDMWAKDSIILFEQSGVIGEDESSRFAPNTGMTRGEFVKIIAKVVALEVAEEDEAIYTDTDGYIYEAYINVCSKAGYINGFEDGSFQPEKAITRAEIVTLINRVIGHSEETDVEVENNPFKDLKETHWAYKEVIKVANFQ